MYRKRLKLNQCCSKYSAGKFGHALQRTQPFNNAHITFGDTTDKSVNIIVSSLRSCVGEACTGRWPAILTQVEAMHMCGSIFVQGHTLQSGFQ
jgi:hypothetical protein